MKSFSLRLSEKNEKAVMNCFLHGGKKIRAAVVVCPGGAYKTLADYEGDVVALKYYKAGFNAFTVKYSVAEKATFPAVKCPLFLQKILQILARFRKSS